MRIIDWLKSATAQLSQAGIGTARLDCLVLLEDVTGRGRAWLLAHSEHELEDLKVRKLESYLLRRLKHEPLAYIRGKSEFFGREFIVNAHTLEPRPETETMIELLLSNVKRHELKQLHLIDVGTGSGCIAITAKLELPDTEVAAIDVDQKCLVTAAQNAKIHNVAIDFYHGNLLKALPTQSTATNILLCNLPYVPDNFQINRAASHEPRHAIFGGSDGLDLFREMFSQIDEMPSKPSYIFTESMPPQHTELALIAAQHSYDLILSEDFVQVFKPIGV